MFLPFWNLVRETAKCFVLFFCFFFFFNVLLLCPSVVDSCAQLEDEMLSRWHPVYVRMIVVLPTSPPSASGIRPHPLDTTNYGRFPIFQWNVRRSNRKCGLKIKKSNQNLKSTYPCHDWLFVFCFQGKLTVDSLTNNSRGILLRSNVDGTSLDKRWRMLQQLFDSFYFSRYRMYSLSVRNKRHRCLKWRQFSTGWPFLYQDLISLSLSFFSVLLHFPPLAVLAP